MYSGDSHGRVFSLIHGSKDMISRLFQRIRESQYLKMLAWIYGGYSRHFCLVLPPIWVQVVGRTRVLHGPCRLQRRQKAAIIPDRPRSPSTLKPITAARGLVGCSHSTARHPRLRTHNQKLTVAAMQMALKNVCAQRSYRVAMRRQSLSLPNRRSMRLRLLYNSVS